MNHSQYLCPAQTTSSCHSHTLQVRNFKRFVSFQNQWSYLLSGQSTEIDSLAQRITSIHTHTYITIYIYYFTPVFAKIVRGKKRELQLRTILESHYSHSASLKIYFIRATTLRTYSQ